jgi:hypothetical protein
LVFEVKREEAHRATRWTTTIRAPVKKTRGMPYSVRKRVLQYVFLLSMRNGCRQGKHRQGVDLAIDYRKENNHLTFTRCHDSPAELEALREYIQENSMKRFIRPSSVRPRVLAVYTVPQSRINSTAVKNRWFSEIDLRDATIGPEFKRLRLRSGFQHRRHEEGPSCAGQRLI